MFRRRTPTSRQRTVKQKQDRNSFPIGIGQAVLAVAGTYIVGTKRMDIWIPNIVAAYSGSSDPSLEDFAHFLADRLTNNITSTQKASGTLIHIAGYTSGDDGTSHPEMWFVRNVESIDPTTGNYLGRSDTFQVSEDFWRRDYGQLARPLQGADAQRYFNGFPPGRITFLQLTKMLEFFFLQVWNQPGWRFRQPNSLDELAEVVELQMRIITTMFRVSDYNVPYIGGPIQIAKIQTPADAMTL